MMVIILTFVMAYAYAMKLDEQQAEEDQRQYCEMVDAGAWPNYKQIDCTEVLYGDK